MAQVNMPNVSQAPKEDALGSLAKGLQIAASVYGIRADSALLDKYNREAQRSELDNQHAQNLQQGILGQGDLLSFSKENIIKPLDPNDPLQAAQANAWLGDKNHPLLVSAKKDIVWKPVYDPTTGMENQVAIDQNALAQGLGKDKAVIATFGGKPAIDPKDFALARQNAANKVFDETKDLSATVRNATTINNLLNEASSSNDPSFVAAKMKLVGDVMGGTPRSPVFTEEIGTPQGLAQKAYNAANLAAQGKPSTELITNLNNTAQILANDARQSINDINTKSAYTFTKNYGGKAGFSAQMDENSPQFQANLVDNTKAMTSLTSDLYAHQDNNDQMSGGKLSNASNSPNGTQNKASYKPGDIRTINNVPMQRDKNGNWSPVSTGGVGSQTQIAGQGTVLAPPQQQGN